MAASGVMQRVGSTSRSVGRRFLATSSESSGSPSTAASTPTLYASLLISRPPLLTPSPSPLESSYHTFTTALRHSISNPPSQTNNFYFKAGSLPLRRFQASHHAYELETYGEALAGPAPQQGDVPAENPVQASSRDHWEKQDAERGERSLERYPESEIFCLLQTKKGKWEFPTTQVQAGESLDEAVKRIRGVDGLLQGSGMDNWLVTRKPVGSYRSKSDVTFFLRSHILAGEPALANTTPYANWAWLTSQEIKQRLSDQGDEQVWQGVQGMFGQGDIGN